MQSRYAIENTLKIDEGGSRLDNYWRHAIISDYYKLFRKGSAIPKSHLLKLDNQSKIIKLYKLRGFQFGNWTTIEDRVNYLYTSLICMYDIQKVLKFPRNNIGINYTLGISFGARGSGSAMAHYEPHSDIINITRYHRLDKINKERFNWGLPPIEMTKEERFIETGGTGSFAHEYGHFLDHYFGMNAEPSKEFEFLTGDGDSISTKRIYKDTPPTQYNQLRHQADLIIYAINYTGGSKSAYRQRLESETKNDYYFMRVELFARAFEQYIQYKLSLIQIHNKFLTQRKYESFAYMNKGEVKRIAPLFDELIKGMRNYL